MLFTDPKAVIHLAVQIDELWLIQMKYLAEVPSKDESREGEHQEEEKDREDVTVQHTPIVALSFPVHIR